jgi:hypothetical protein
MEQGELESLGADEQLVPLSEAKQLQARVRELERLLGKKTLEAEILREALELSRSKKIAVALELARTGRFQVKTVAQAMGVARSNLAALLKPAGRSPRRPPPDDEWLLPMIRAIVAERVSYDYRRVNRAAQSPTQRGGSSAGQPQADLPHHVDQSVAAVAFSGRRERSHDGVVITLKSNLRWCSDVFIIRCWNGEAVQVLFSLDCCDHEVMGWLATSGGVPARWCVT